MSKKDHYAILGIERTEDESSIKTAFRQLAKRYHPDLSGPETTRRFQEIVEAYEVLSDPESRASYNRSIGARDAAQAPPQAESGPSAPTEKVRTTRSPHRWKVISHGGPWSGPFAEEVFDGFMGSFAERARTVLGLPQGRILNAEIILSPEEAGRGGVLPLRHPGLSRCRFCGRVGLDERWVCRFCRRGGGARDSEVFSVRIPAGVRDGATLEFHIGDTGTTTVLLRIHLRVRGR